MPTNFSLTFDSTHDSLVLVAGEAIIDDLTAVRITRTTTGYDCEVVRAGNGSPVKLVAAASPAGKQALARAIGKLSAAAPGFVELETAATTNSSVAEDIARYLGRELPAAGEQATPSY
jgi:hypothetical protein